MVNCGTIIDNHAMDSVLCYYYQDGQQGVAPYVAQGAASGER